MPNPISMPDNGNPNVNTNRCFFMPTPINHGIAFMSGMVMPFAGTVAPPGWLLCDGRAVSRTEYPQLFEVIGTRYGNGDGETTFNLPSLHGKFIEGTTTTIDIGSTKEAGLPNITGTIEAWGCGQITHGTHTTTLKYTGCVGNRTGTNADGAIGYALQLKATANRDMMVSPHIDASKSNAIYGKSTTVQPPAVLMIYIIKT